MARAAKEEAEAQGAAQRDQIKKAVNAAKDEGFPTDLEEKEAYFMGQVAKGESLCAEGSFDVVNGIVKPLLTSFKAQITLKLLSLSTRRLKYTLNLKTSFRYTTRLCLRMYWKFSRRWLHWTAD